MNQEMKAKFSDAVRAEASKLYGVDSLDLNLLGSHQNFVYSYKKDGKEYILRISHSNHRNVEQIEAELNWLEFLAERDVLVSVPIYSDAGHLIEIFENNYDQFNVVAFNKAPGLPWSDSITQNEEFRRLGMVAGKMHALAKKYTPLTTQPKRFMWNENDYLKFFARNLPNAHHSILSNFQNLIKKIHLLPKSPESFGLIHGDLCFGNYFVETDGSITVFDFDESQYGWFVQDIAVNLFYGIAVPSEEEDEISFTQRYLTSFLEGYAQENVIDRKMLLEQLPLFLDLRQAILFSSLHRNGDIENLDTWSQTFLERAKKNMQNGTPFIEIERLKL